MKIMIVGGTGFLGYYATQVALDRGYEVGAFALDDVNLEGWWPKEVPVGHGDLFQMTEDELVPVFEGYDAFIYSVGPDEVSLTILILLILIVYILKKVLQNTIHISEAVWNRPLS